MLVGIGFGKSAGPEIGPEPVAVVELDQTVHMGMVLSIVGLVETIWLDFQMGWSN